MMKNIDLNELTSWSTWPKRLLGLSPSENLSRTIDEVDKEYEKGKYSRCLDYYSQNNEQASPEKIRQFEFDFDGLNNSSQMCVSQGGELYLTSLGEARERQDDIIYLTMHDAIEKSASVVELGCGYGYNLWKLSQRFPDKVFTGGEYAKNAVHLASFLYKSIPTVSVSQFNFYESVYKLVDQLEPPVTLFTVHAIEQLPSAKSVLDTIATYHDKISAVFHFEPAYELNGDTLLGLMRQRYVLLNDYNRDLMSEIRFRENIRVISIQEDVLGLNPLNPISVIHWEFIT